MNVESIVGTPDDHPDSSSGATTITSGQTLDGSIEAPGDTDYFTFQAAANAAYTIETRLVSNPDTILELYDASGSRIARNDDFGRDRASKIEWTAQAQGRYYIQVGGYGDATGSYQLSLTPQRPPATPTPPRFTLTSTSQSSVEFGESFMLSVRIHRVGGSGDHGGVSVSFPTLDRTGASSRGYSSSQADVEVVSYTPGVSNVNLYDSGNTITYSDDARRRAQHLLVETDDASWSIVSDRTLVLRITPKQRGRFPIKIRGWICSDGYQGCNRYGQGTTDQQGWSATLRNVTVGAPSDDYSNTRNGASRIDINRIPSRDGARELTVPGNIQYDSDVDYFRFHAERGRRYIMDVQLGSLSDSVIELYDSSGTSVAVDDDGGAGYASRLEWRAGSSGTYYIAVRGFDEEERGSYRLTLREES